MRRPEAAKSRRRLAELEEAVVALLPQVGERVDGRVHVVLGEDPAEQIDLVPVPVLRARGAPLVDAPIEERPALREKFLEAGRPAIPRPLNRREERLAPIVHAPPLGGGELRDARERRVK